MDFDVVIADGYDLGDGLSGQLVPFTPKFRRLVIAVTTGTIMHSAVRAPVTSRLETICNGNVLLGTINDFSTSSRSIDSYSSSSNTGFDPIVHHTNQ